MKRLFLMGLFLVLVGCAPPEPPAEEAEPETAEPAAPETAEPAGPEYYEAQGTVTAIDPDTSSVTIDHEAIPGLMDAMEMSYTAADAGLLEGIEVGTTVRFRLAVENGNYTLEEIEPVEGGEP